MNKCLKITMQVEPSEGFLSHVVQKYAREFDLEGFAQTVAAHKIKIIVCGKREQVDSFVDMLHKESLKSPVHDIEIEPFLKDKDYRGVFRIIE